MFCDFSHCGSCGSRTCYGECLNRTNGRLDDVVFIDLDGVLNNHYFNNDEDVMSSTLDHENVIWLNHILRTTGAKLVLSSAWRYMVSPDAMTLKGFEYLLRTHGVAAKDRLIGFTPRDEEVPTRGMQITAWLKTHGSNRRYVVLDDGGTTLEGNWDDLGIEEAGHPVIWCDGETGITRENARDAIFVLDGGCSDCLGQLTCNKCFGSGGGEGPWQCGMCGGSGSCCCIRGEGVVVDKCVSLI